MDLVYHNLNKFPMKILNFKKLFLYNMLFKDMSPSPATKLFFIYLVAGDV